MIQYYNERKKEISYKKNHAMRMQHKKLENAEWDLDANQ
jgi:hypothetical protein